MVIGRFGMLRVRCRPARRLRDLVRIVELWSHSQIQRRLPETRVTRSQYRNPG